MIVLAGFVMDSISGAPFGIYLTTYFWIVIGIKSVTTVFHVKNRLLLPFVVTAGILIENFFFLIAITFIQKGLDSSLRGVTEFLKQVLWAAVTGPLFLLALKWIYGIWDKFTGDWFARENGK